jgi:hydrogenase-4 component F
MVIPVVAGAAALVLLGVHPPAGLTELLTRGAAELRGLA